VVWVGFVSGTCVRDKVRTAEVWRVGRVGGAAASKVVEVENLETDDDIGKKAANEWAKECGGRKFQGKGVWWLRARRKGKSGGQGVVAHMANRGKKERGENIVGWIAGESEGCGFVWWKFGWGFTGFGGRVGGTRLTHHNSRGGTTTRGGWGGWGGGGGWGWGGVGGMFGGWV